MATKGNGFFTRRRDFTLERLAALASPRIIRRGLGYAGAGRVQGLVAAPDRLEARVIGTEREPYLVTLEHDGEEILSTCSCPFTWEPLCKHAIAVLAEHFSLGAPATAGVAEGPEAGELAVRRARGMKEDFVVKRLEGESCFGIFAVQSAKGLGYQVEIRSLRESVNRCTCPDYAGSMLGTCKHIEAVLVRLRTRAPRAYERAARLGSGLAQILLDMRDTPRIRLLLPARPSESQRRLSQDYFDRAGCLLGDPVADFDRMRSRARLVPGVVVYKDAEEWSEHLAHQRLSRRRKEEILRAMQGARIPGIRGELYPYQLEGAAFLAAGGRGLLADDMGLGKTLQAIAGAQILRNRDELRRALVLCPASLKSQWAAEILRFTGETAMIVDGGPAERLEQYRARRPFTISNYELALRDGQAIAELAPDLLIVDEAQRIRNWRTRTAEAIKTIRTPFAFVLTGTPLQNRLDDLYSVMQVVDRRVLGPLWAFNEQFMIRTEDRGRIEGYKNLDELRRRLAPVLLRRDKSDVMRQLPERIDTRRLTPLTARQRELMEEGVATAAKLAATARRRNLLPKEQERLFKAMQRARMACNAAGLVDKESIGSPKLDELEQLLSDLCLDEGRKVVVFSEWERFCRMAAQRAEKLGIPHVRLHGRVPSAQRGALIERFREDPDCRVFFSTDAGGVGLNLQFAGTLINLDLPWNPAVLEQRIGRVHRHGQQERVHVLLLIAEDSFESGLERTLGSKRQLFDAALDPRSEEISVHAPASCLETVRQALGESDTEAGDSIESQEGDAPREAHSPLTAGQERPTAAGPPHLEGLDEPLAHLAACLGPRLGKAFRLASGQLVALVDRVDDITRAAARKAGVALMETSALDGLAALGADSPFATAQLLLDQEGFQDALGSARRAEWQALARRKLSAARLLAAGDQGSESMAQVQAGMIAALKSLIVEEGHWALPTLRLVHEVLVPAGRLDLEQAAAIARAMALAAAYVDSPQAAPAALVEGVIADAERLLDGCLRDGNVNPPTEPTLLVRSSMAGARSSLPPSGK